MPRLAAYLSPNRLIAEQLRHAPLFANLPIDHRDCLALLREGAFFEVPSGVEIVSAGDPPALIIVIKGALGDDSSARSWHAGNHLGAAEALTGRPFAASVRTVAPSLLYRLDASLLHALPSRCPMIARRLREDFAATFDFAAGTLAGPSTAPAEAPSTGRAAKNTSLIDARIA